MRSRGICLRLRIVKQQMAQQRALPVMLLENSVDGACLKSYRPDGA